MNCNKVSNTTDNSVIDLDTSDDSFIYSDEDNVISVKKQINNAKISLSDTASDSIIIVEKSDDRSLPDKNKFQSQDENFPMFKVIFRDKAVLQKYQRQIREFFQKLVEVDLKNSNSNDSELIMEIWDHSKPNIKNDEYHVTNNKDCLLFTIDNTPGDQDEYNIPTYGKKFESVLKQSRNNSDAEITNDRAMPKVNCFNCSGDHLLHDCPEPRNPMEINRNRKEFTTRNRPRNARYHIDDEQKNKPGVLSSELRKALGLDDDQLPKHIFKMRLIGYPPGWLEEAKLEHSGLNLYNSEGNRERDPSEEAGEIFIPESKTQFDMKKLHDFPGFNIPAPPGTRDAFWSTEQQLLHSKETMLRMLSNRKIDEGYKRKKLKISMDESSPNDNCTHVEMDVELPEDVAIESISANGHLEAQIQNSPTMHTKTVLSDGEKIDIQSSITTKNENCEVVSRADSPSLSDLEIKKKLLLDALDDSNSISNLDTPGKSMINESILKTPKSSTANISQSTPISIFENIDSTPKHGSVKSIEFGTPILKNASMYTKLPSSESFSKNICDVINFENLPSATGMYDKINGILQKVRNTMNNN